MAVREKSLFIPNEIYFITFTILDWKPIFISNFYCKIIYNWFDYMNKAYGNRVYGYVIMPNHVHVLLKITGESPPLSKLMQNGKRFMAYEIIKTMKQENKKELLEHFASRKYGNTNASYKVFKERYDSLLITTEKFFREKLKYIHNNPCQPKWNLAKEPEDYLYSSASNYMVGEGAYSVSVMKP
jgi:putative transposase